MSRLQTRFAELREQKRKALIPFITAGDPSAEVTLELMHALVKAGADALELGVPFSDPVADGPVIQKACERALQGGMTLRKVLNLVEQFRAKDAQTPVILMGYLNPIEMLGYAQFADFASSAGVDGVLVVDMPPEESETFTQALAATSIDQIFMLTPTSPPERIQRVSSLATGFIYYVSLKGVTGAATLDVDAVAAKLAQIKQYTDKPVAVGFGINSPEVARKIAHIADAVIVGSAVVKLVEQTPETAECLVQVGEFVNSLRKAMDQV